MLARAAPLRELNCGADIVINGLRSSTDMTLKSETPCNCGVGVIKWPKVLPRQRSPERLTKFQGGHVPDVEEVSAEERRGRSVHHIVRQDFRVAEQVDQKLYRDMRCSYLLDSLLDKATSAVSIGIERGSCREMCHVRTSYLRWHAAARSRVLLKCPTWFRSSAVVINGLRLVVVGTCTTRIRASILGVVAAAQLLASVVDVLTGEAGV
jgi:hypothetical protein